MEEECSYEDFQEIADRVMFFIDLQKAAEEQAKDEERRENITKG